MPRSAEVGLLLWCVFGDSCNFSQNIFTKNTQKNFSKTLTKIKKTGYINNMKLALRESEC